MLQIMSDLPDSVLGVTASGKVSAEDYASTLVPAVEELRKRHNRIRLLYHFDGSFSKLEVGAMWQDAKVGLRHLTAWERGSVYVYVPEIGEQVGGLPSPDNSPTD